MSENKDHERDFIHDSLKRYAVGMDPVVKEKWVTSLRSGEYRQVFGRLSTPTAGPLRELMPNGRCCLGVLCEVAGIGISSDGDSTETNYSDLDSLLSIDLRRVFVSANDIYQLPFDRIADLVEECL